MAHFHLSITDWYRLNKRDLPWRHTKDPYAIWLSEVILQQTRVDQGMDYFLKFLRNYPNIHALANASEQDILNDWQGLGYYSRARNLHKTAQIISKELNGTFPDSFTELLTLKGIGTYTAAAIASFAYNEKVPVVDGNVYRVLSRYFDIDLPIDTTAGKKLFFELAAESMGDAEPSLFNQAIMEFGALQCTPKNPDCSICPLSDSCLSLHSGNVTQRPVKSKRTKVTDRYFHYFVFRKDGKTALMKRTRKDIWQNMFEFPMIESTGPSLTVKPDFLREDPILLHSTKHILSHQRIHAFFYLVYLLPQNTENLEIIDQSDIQNFPLPRLIDRFLEEKEPFDHLT